MKVSYKHLGAEDTGAIIAMTAQGSSARAIVRAVRRLLGTITRERLRNAYLSQACQTFLGRPRIAGGYDAVNVGRRAS